MRKGDRVYIKSEYLDKGEESIEWRVVEPEEKGRVTIVALLGLPINPTQVIPVSYIERVEQ